MTTQLAVNATRKWRAAAMNEERPKDGDIPMPESPRVHPEQTVDALEEKIMGETKDQERDESDTDRPAFELDIDPADTTGEQGGHTEDEPPV